MSVIFLRAAKEAFYYFETFAVLYNHLKQADSDKKIHEYRAILLSDELCLGLDNSTVILYYTNSQQTCKISSILDFGLRMCLTFHL